MSGAGNPSCLHPFREGPGNQFGGRVLAGSGDKFSALMAILSLNRRALQASSALSERNNLYRGVHGRDDAAGVSQ